MRRCRKGPYEEAQEEEKEGNPDGYSLISTRNVVDELHQGREDPHGPSRTPRTSVMQGERAITHGELEMPERATHSQPITDGHLPGPGIRRRISLRVLEGAARIRLVGSNLQLFCKNISSQCLYIKVPALKPEETAKICGDEAYAG